MALMESALIAGVDDGLTVGIRAEKVSVAPQGQGRLACVVSESEFLGSETLIGLDLDGAVGLTVMQPGLALMPAGETLEITFEDKDLHFFDKAGARIAGR